MQYTDDKHFWDQETSTLLAVSTEITYKYPDHPEKWWPWLKVNEIRITRPLESFKSIKEIGGALQVDPWQQLFLRHRDQSLFPLAEARGKAVLRTEVHEPGISYEYHIVVDLCETKKYRLNGIEEKFRTGA